MKTTRYDLLLLLMLAACCVSAQNTIYVYRNDGMFNAFFEDEVDSITYSQIDIDSVMHENYVVQEIHTSDSVYRIPLNAIDSIGFNQPEIIYEEDVVHMAGEFLDNIVEVNDYELVFSLSTPTHLLPQVGDKLAALELTSHFPLGFAGKVAKITTTEKGFVYECDTLYIDDVASKFYGLIELSNADETGGMMKLKTDNLKYHRLPFPSRVPVNLDISDNFIRSECAEIYNVGPGFSISGNVDPIIRVAVSAGIDKFVHLNVVNVLYDAEMKEDLDISLMGKFEVSKKKVKIVEKTIPVVGIPVYVAVGVNGSAAVNVAAKWNYNGRSHHKGTISYAPDIYLQAIADIHNILSNKNEFYDNNFSFDGLVGEIEINMGGFLDIGLGKKNFWGGFEFELGLNGETKFPKEATISQFVYDFMKPITNSDFYDKYNEYLKLAWTVRLGTYIAGEIGKGDGSTTENESTTEEEKKFWKKFVKFLKEGFSGRIGADWEILRLDKLNLSLWPQFQTAENNHQGKDWTIKTDLNDKCLLSYQLGYALFDDNDNHIENVYFDQKYRFSLFSDKFWKPSFTSYSCSFTNLVEDKHYKAYPIFDFLGKEIIASPVVMMDMCPDDKHPHAFDLDFPTGTMWSCCNIGANTPHEYGNYYAWGETNTKESYDEKTYRYYDDLTFEYVNIGEQINNTRYDVAKTEWKEKWHMPTYEDFETFGQLCKKRAYSLNGVKGLVFEGNNGQSIFLPFAGDMHGSQLTGDGDYGYYWSGTQKTGYDSGAYNLFLTNKPSATINYGRRHLGRTVRPVKDAPMHKEKQTE